MEKTEVWVSELEDNSSVIQKYCDRTTLDDTSGWGERFKALVQGGDMPSGLLLTGREGTGKHNAAFHMVKLLSEKSYRTVFISGSDMKESASFVKAGIDSMLDSAYDSKTPLCLVIDNPEECGFISEILNFLGKSAMEYRLNKGKYPELFIILINGTDIPVPSMLRSLLTTCVMSCPTINERNRMLSSFAKFLNLDALLKMTEGMTYSQLMGIKSGLNMEIDSKDGVFISEENMKNFVTSQTVSTGSGKNSLYTKLEALLDNLPDILSNVNIGSGNGNSVGVNRNRQSFKTEETVIQSDPAQHIDSREELDNMPVRQLTTKLFGEERAAQLLQQ